MKKNTPLIIFSLAILIFLIILLITSEVYGSGIDLNQDYDSDFGKHFIGEYYINTSSSYSALFCNGHGKPFFNKRELAVTISGTVNGQGFSLSADDLLPLPQVTRSGEAFNQVGNVNEGDDVGDKAYYSRYTVWRGSHYGSPKCASHIFYTLNIETEDCTAIKNGVVGPQIGTLSASGSSNNPPPADEDGGNWYSVYSSGPTVFTMEQYSTFESNNKIAYLIAQAEANTPGLLPSNSEANWAWWERHDENITSDFRSDMFSVDDDSDYSSTNIESVLQDFKETIENVPQNVLQKIIEHEDNPITNWTKEELENKIKDLTERNNELERIIHDSEEEEIDLETTRRQIHFIDEANDVVEEKNKLNGINNNDIESLYNEIMEFENNLYKSFKDETYYDRLIGLNENLNLNTNVSLDNNTTVNLFNENIIVDTQKIKYTILDIINTMNNTTWTEQYKEERKKELAKILEPLTMERIDIAVDRVRRGIRDIDTESDLLYTERYELVSYNAGRDILTQTDLYYAIQNIVNIMNNPNLTNEYKQQKKEELAEPLEPLTIQRIDQALDRIRRGYSINDEAQYLFSERKDIIAKNVKENEEGNQINKKEKREEIKRIEDILKQLNELPERDEDLTEEQIDLRINLIDELKPIPEGILYDLKETQQTERMEPVLPKIKSGEYTYREAAEILYEEKIKLLEHVQEEILEKINDINKSLLQRETQQMNTGTDTIDEENADMKEAIKNIRQRMDSILEMENQLKEHMKYTNRIDPEARRIMENINEQKRTLERLWQQFTESFVKKEDTKEKVQVETDSAVSKEKKVKQDLDVVKKKLREDREELLDNKRQLETTTEIDDNYDIYSKLGNEMTVEEAIKIAKELIDAIENGQASIDNQRVEINGEIIDINAIEELRRRIVSTWKSVEGEAAELHDGMLIEARTFERMHEMLGSKDQVDVDYGASIEDKTDYENVKVHYDSKNQQYLVGPFNIEYMEVYALNNQFAGIFDDPVLTVEGLNGEVEMPLSGGEWQIVFKERDEKGNLIRGQDGQLVDKARKETGTEIGLTNIVPKPVDGETVLTDFDLYPHTNEDFYILINYAEGVHKLKGIEFNFRCLTAQGSWESVTGIIKKYKWQSSMVIPSGSCPVIIGYTKSGRPIRCGNYTSAYINVRRVRKSDIEIQPFMEVIDAVREYSELIAINRQNLTMKILDDRIIVKFNMDIDLTTIVAGDVWVEELFQKGGEKSNATEGKKEEIEKEKGLQNVAVTVYVYEGLEKKRKAISHDEENNELIWPIYTDENGHYQINRLEAPGSVDKSAIGQDIYYVIEFEYDGQQLHHTLYLSTNGKTSSAPDEYTNAVLEAEDSDYFKSSMAVEEVDTRYIFDQTFGEITGDESIQGTTTNGITNTTDQDGKGAAPNGEQIFNELLYEGEAKEIENKKEESQGVTRIHSKLDSPYNEKRDGRTMEKTSIEGNQGEQDKHRRYRMMATTFYNEQSDIHGVNVNKQNFRIKYPIGDVYILNAKRSTVGGAQTVDSPVDGGGTRPKVLNGYINEYMLHINLGLKERYETDMSLLKDLQKVTVVVNEQLITKEYNQFAKVAEYNDLLINLEKVSENGYVLGLYSADIDYQSIVRYINAVNQIKKIKEGTELRVFATYVIRAYNNSISNDVEFNVIRDYYDKTFTLVDKNNYDDEYDEEAKGIKVSIAKDNIKREEKLVAEAPYYRICDSEAGEAPAWKSTREENLEGFDGKSGDLEWDTSEADVNSFHSSSTTTLTEIKLTKTQYVEIFTTYEVDKEGFKNAEGSIRREGEDKLTGDKYNVAEIANYSTYYTEEDTKLNDEATPYYCGFKEGWVSGKVDKDSAPNNINRNDIKNINEYEDDTYQAPILHINVKANSRSMQGTVWNDDVNSGTGIRDEDHIANGIYEGEEGVGGVQVSLYEVINMASLEDEGAAQYAGLDYYYKIPDNGEYIATSTTGNDGKWEISNFLPGDYSVRFDYGNGESGQEVRFNGQDYQNTKFMTNYKTTAESLNIKYYDLTDANLSESKTSKARDNESRRMVVDSYSRNIENERGEILRDKLAEEYIEATNMFAETPIMQVEVEDPLKIKYPEGSIFNKDNEYDKLVDPIEHGNTDTAEYVIKNINFGLEERERVDLKLEKFIDAIYLVKSGTVIFTAYIDESGNIITDHEKTQGLDKATYIGHEVATKSNQQGFFTIAIEEEYMNDLSLAITYKMKVINNSEVDYTGKIANYYLASVMDQMAYGDLNTTDWYQAILGYFDDEEQGCVANNRVKDKVAEYLENQELIASDGNVHETDTIKPEAIVYGKFVGRYYYTNEVDENPATFKITNYAKMENVTEDDVPYPEDVVVRTVADQLVDYIDVDTNLDLEENTNIQNSSWDLIEKETEEEELDKLISQNSYKEGMFNGVQDTGLYDNKDRRMIQNVVSNIAFSHNRNLERNSEDNRMKYIDGLTNPMEDYNNELTVELVPVKYAETHASEYPIENPEVNQDRKETTSTIYITTRKNIASDKDANDALLDNLVEILVYSNPIGRRDRNSVPGNAMDLGKTEGLWRAGYNSIGEWGGDFAAQDFDKNISSEGILKPENDAHATEYVTLIPPTGLATLTLLRNNVYPLTGMIIVLVGLASIFIIKQKKILNNK